MIRHTFKTLWLSIITCGVMIFSSALHANDIIKIGMVLPETGPLTQYGDMLREGVLTASEHINAKGGVLGKQIKIVFVDDACEPKQGPVAANRFVNEKIGFVIGPVCSGSGIAAAPVYEEEGVIMITPAATSPAITVGKNYHFIFRTIGRDDQQAPIAAKFIVEKLKPKRVAVLHDKQSYGQGIAGNVHDALKKAGLNIVLHEGVNANDTDYSSVITKLKANDIDFVYFGGYHPELGLLLRQSSEQGIKAQFMGPEAVSNPDLNAIAGNASEGLLLTLPADLTDKPENAEIVKAFLDKKRNPRGPYQITTYAALQALVAGIEGTKSEDPEKVADWLHSNSVQTTLGEISWDKQGDLNHFDFAVFKWHTDGTKTSLE